jgi:hypothetical protein
VGRAFRPNSPRRWTSARRLQGHWRVVAFTGGRVDGPEFTGELIPVGGADWQILRPDRAAVADIRYTLRTETGALLLVMSTGMRHGPPEILARWARGEDVSAGTRSVAGGDPESP